jgi:hypothetical protein
VLAALDGGPALGLRRRGLAKGLAEPGLHCGQESVQWEQQFVIRHALFVMRHWFIRDSVFVSLLIVARECRAVKIAQMFYSSLF